MKSTYQSKAEKAINDAYNLFTSLDNKNSLPAAGYCGVIIFYSTCSDKDFSNLVNSALNTNLSVNQQTLILRNLLYKSTCLSTNIKNDVESAIYSQTHMGLQSLSKTMFGLMLKESQSDLLQK